jgi:hypothetical protein
MLRNSKLVSSSNSLPNKSTMDRPFSRINVSITTKTDDLAKGLAGDSSPTDINEFESLGILCINCQEIISEHEIEKHSQHCTTISETVKRFDSGNVLPSILLRLDKLKQFLTFIQSTNDFKPADRNILVILIRNLDGLKSVQSVDNMTDVKRVITSLETLLKNFRGNTNNRLYAERVLALSHELYLFLQEEELIQKRRELEELKNQVESYKTQAESLEFSLKRSSPKLKLVLNKLEDISSDLGSNASNLTSLSEFTARSEDTNSIADNKDMRDFEEVVSQEIDPKQISDDQQRQFYAQCLSYKLNFPNRHPAQKVPILDLYKKSIQDEVPLAKWGDFINQELKNAAKWVATSSNRRKRVQPKNVPSRFLYFESIQEEQQEG